VQDGIDREPLGILARLLDEEGAVEAVRLADPADPNELGQSTISTRTR
jgi:hypothetical protein